MSHLFGNFSVPANSWDAKCKHLFFGLSPTSSQQTWLLLMMSMGNSFIKKIFMVEKQYYRTWGPSMLAD
jgi:hypothetical protein